MTHHRAHRDAAPGTVRFAVVTTSLGALLVAATDRGVCLTALGTPAEEAQALLAKRFPGASLEPADPGTREWAATIATHAEGESDDTAIADIPLDLCGTPFQLAVWEQLRAIPRGSTITYGELARRVGRPSAVRAVAQACGANPVGVVVPCHRVIGADGSLTGFASGLERKRVLLEREGAL